MTLRHCVAERIPMLSKQPMLDPAHEDWDFYMPDDLKMANQTPASDMPALPEAFIAVP